MNEDTFKTLKATMPWTEQSFATNRGALVQVVDNQGREVPIYTMTAFLAFITSKLVAPKVEKEKAE